MRGKKGVWIENARFIAPGSHPGHWLYGWNACLISGKYPQDTCTNAYSEIFSGSQQNCTELCFFLGTFWPCPASKEKGDELGSQIPFSLIETQEF
jgi:hypothetical protein